MRRNHTKKREPKDSLKINYEIDNMQNIYANKNISH